jgi:hypothetical protein
MANDIKAINSGLPIKNGSIVVSCGFVGFPSGVIATNDRNVKNIPAIATIQSKYDARFDDPSYYFGNGVQGT